MKVIVAGAGLVGYNIARYLAAAGNDVVIIDQRPELVRKIGDHLDIQAMVGHASHPSTLEAAGAEDADMFIAVTQADEVNMVACQVAHTLFNVPTKIARVRQQDYLQDRCQDLFRRDHLPIDVVISPEVEVAHAIALRLEVPGASNVVPFADDRVRLIAVRCTADTPIINTPLRQLTYLFPDLHLVCVGVVRGDQFFIPHADDQLRIDDEVHFVVETAHLERALPAFGYEERMSDRIIIVGGGNIGLFLAKELEARYPHLLIKVIESNPDRAELIADELHRVVVLCGDARDRALLDEANVKNAQAIVTVTNDDEVNIMAGAARQAARLQPGAGTGQQLDLQHDRGPHRPGRGDQPTRDDGFQRAAARPPRQVEVGAHDPRRRGRDLRGRGARDVAARRQAAQGVPLRRRPDRRRDHSRRQGADAAQRHRRPGARPSGDAGAQRRGAQGRATVRRAPRLLLTAC